MAGWSALTASEQALNSVMSTVLSKLNAVLDSELEQVICFDGNIDAELFASETSALFLILPEEDATKNFVASLMIQNLARELFAVANEHGGKLQNRAVFFCDELGAMPPFDILPLFSTDRSRRLTLVPIIQSLAQLVKNYGSEGAEIIQDNCQDTIFGGFAPNSQTAETLSKNMGNRCRCRTGDTACVLCREKGTGTGVLSTHENSGGSCALCHIRTADAASGNTGKAESGGRIKAGSNKGACQKERGYI